MNRSTDDDIAFRSHTRRKATEKFNEVIRSNTRTYDEPTMSEDDRAYADYAIRLAAQIFHQETYYNPYE